MRKVGLALPVLWALFFTWAPAPLVEGGSGGRPVAAPRVLSDTLSFAPFIDVIAARVDSAAYFPWVYQLAGGEPVTVGGQTISFTTRFSLSPQCDLAEQYVFERFLEMGFEAAYDSFRLSGSPARNIIANHVGQVSPRRVVILCGHLDSISQDPLTSAPGANDNATGVAGVLTAARILRNYTFQSTIRFIAFTGEEQGAFGSSHYAFVTLDPGDTLIAVVNLDMIGYYATRGEIDLEGPARSEPVMRVMEEACARYTNVAAHLRLGASSTSDHLPFAQLGIPAFLVTETNYRADLCYHRSCDTVERIRGAFGAEVTRAAVATVAHLAGVLAPPPEPPGVSGLIVAPNPFRAELTIQLPEPGSAARHVEIFTVAGRRLRVLDLAPGAQVAVWDGRAEDGRAAPSGVYFIRLGGGGGVFPALQVVRLPE